LAQQQEQEELGERADTEDTLMMEQAITDEISSADNINNNNNVDIYNDEERAESDEAGESIEEAGEEEMVQVGDRMIPLSEVTEEDTKSMTAEEYTVCLNIQLFVLVLLAVESYVDLFFPRHTMRNTRSSCLQWAMKMQCKSIIPSKFSFQRQ
jgi:hypothetical protein